MSQLFTRTELKDIKPVLPPELQERVERYLDGSLCRRCMGQKKAYKLRKKWYIDYNRVYKKVDCPACGGVGYFEEEGPRLETQPTVDLLKKALGGNDD